MRLILLCLAIANFRWSRADLDRSERLYAEADAAYDRSEARARLALAQSAAVLASLRQHHIV